MISLTIDGREAVLGTGFSFEFTRSNPFFDGAGDYTYEVELSLLNKDNSQLYAGINRPNAKSYPTGRRVVVKSNLTTIIDGTEILLDKKDSTVRIQIVANESQFNLDGGNKTLQELNLQNPYVPSTESLADNRMYDSIVRNCYPTFAYALPLIFNGDPGWGWDPDLNDKIYNPHPYSPKSDEVVYIPQPYLLWVIDRVVNAMGYRLGYNYLATVEKYKRLCIVNGVLLDDMGLRLPDWTVDEFFSEVEKFFGVVCQFDGISKTVDIVTVDDFYSRNDSLELSDDCILDSFDLEMSDNKASFSNQYLNVRYDIGSSEPWKLADLDDEIYRTCRKEDKLVTEPYDVESIDEFDQVVYYDKIRSFEWIRYKSAAENARFTNTLVNQFRRHHESDDVSETSLRIVPAFTRAATFARIWAPYSRLGIVPDAMIESRGTFSELIRGEKKSSSSVMRVAYAILARPRTVEGNPVVNEDPLFDPYPLALVSSYNNYFVYPIPFGDDAFKEGGYLYGQNYYDYTLSLEGEHGRIEQDLKNDLTIDTTKKYTFRFVSHELLSAKRIFLIRGRRYICAELRYSVVNCDLSEIVEGDFYPMKYKCS